jgi:hypothetical protein
VVLEVPNIEPVGFEVEVVPKIAGVEGAVVVGPLPAAGVAPNMLDPALAEGLPKMLDPEAFPKGFVVLVVVPPLPLPPKILAPKPVVGCWLLLNAFMMLSGRRRGRRANC